MKDYILTVCKAFMLGVMVTTSINNLKAGYYELAVFPIIISIFWVILLVIGKPKIKKG